MKKWVKEKKTQLICYIVLFLIALPNMAAIKYAIFTPDDFKFAMGTDTAGNAISILFGKLVNPMWGLNYGLLRITLFLLFVFFVISFTCFVYLFLEEIGIDNKKRIVLSTVVVGSFLFFKEYYELFFWWTGAVFYELPIALILSFLVLYLIGNKKNNKWIKMISLLIVVLILLANLNIGTVDWMRANRDEDVNFIKAVYYTLCVVENECKNYVKNTGFILVLMCVFFAGLKTKKAEELIKTIENKVYWIVLPFACIYPMVFQRNVYNIDRLPNRGAAVIDLFLVFYLSLAALWGGLYVGSKTENIDIILQKTMYVFITLSAIVFCINLKGTSDVLIGKNLMTKQVQSYSETWSSIYYVCDNTDDKDLVIETCVENRVEGCCQPKLRSKTTSEKNEVLASFFGLNTISLNNTYEE